KSTASIICRQLPDMSKFQSKMLKMQQENSDNNSANRPPPAKIARERWSDSNKNKYKSRGASDVKKICLRDRVNQFPNQHLCVRSNAIFCNACKEVISSKKSIVVSHCSSKKHESGKAQLQKSKLRDQTIAEALSREKSQKESTLPLAERAYRQQVVEEFLKAGIPIHKVDKLRPLLEKNGYRLTGSSNLGQYISLTFKQETERIKQEISAPGSTEMTREVSVIFDGSTRQGEAIAIIVRFINDDWLNTQRLMRIDICSKSVNSEQLARVLNECLSVEYGIKANSLLAAMRDGASVNQAALNRIAFIFPNLLNVVCFSHTLDNVAKRIVPQLQAIMSDPRRLIDLKLELAVTIDVGQHFVKATYYLEGDGPLVFSCYEKLKAVAEACQNPHFPNVRAVAVSIANQDPTQNVETLEQRAKECVQPAIRWFLRKFNVELYNTVSAFKAARIMCPVAVQWLAPTAETIKTLKIFPFLNNDATIDALVKELPQYVAAAQDVIISSEEKKVEWWKHHAEQLPNWSSAVKKVLLVQPSSAAAERAFSILNASFNDQQHHALSDYLQ
ncbi:DNA-directed primase polymerase, partial [Paramuricea clavata]